MAKMPKADSVNGELFFKMVWIDLYENEIGAVTTLTPLTPHDRSSLRPGSWEPHPWFFIKSGDW
jgi:hypothetical protein